MCLVFVYMSTCLKTSFKKVMYIFFKSAHRPQRVKPLPWWSCCSSPPSPRTSSRRKGCSSAWALTSSISSSATFSTQCPNGRPPPPSPSSSVTQASPVLRPVGLEVPFFLLIAFSFGCSLFSSVLEGIRALGKPHNYVLNPVSQTWARGIVLFKKFFARFSSRGICALRKARNYVFHPVS